MKIKLVKCVSSKLSFYSFLHQASRCLLQRARLVRSPKSPKQLPSTLKKSFPWQRKEQITLVQFVALFDDLKKDGSEWPTFGNHHEYWNRAAAFVQETTGTEFRRSGESNSSYLLLIYVLHPRQNYDLALFFPNLFGNFLEFFKFS